MIDIALTLASWKGRAELDKVANLSLSVRCGSLFSLLTVAPLANDFMVVLEEWRLAPLLKLLLMVVSLSKSSSLVGLGIWTVSKTSSPAPPPLV